MSLLIDTFEDLPVTLAHAHALSGLPMIHRDPFDRLLVAQAIHESFTVITRDRLIPKYDVPVLTA